MRRCAPVSVARTPGPEVDVHPRVLPTQRTMAAAKAGATKPVRARTTPYARQSPDWPVAPAYTSRRTAAATAGISFARSATRVPGLANVALSAPGISRLLRRAAGVTTDRPGTPPGS